MNQSGGNRSVLQEPSLSSFPVASSATPVTGAALRVLGECRGFIAGLDAATYAAPSRVLAGGSIGKHLRHTLDHFAAVALALDGGTICYDQRTRDVPMETEPGAGLAEIHRLRELLGTVTATRLAAVVNVRILCSAEGEEAEVASTLGRELAFATHHAIHHQAMMKAIAIERGLTFGSAASTAHGAGPAVSATFGVAPSTVQHAAEMDGQSRLKPAAIAPRS